MNAGLNHPVRHAPRRRLPVWVGVLLGVVVLLCVGAGGIAATWMAPQLVRPSGEATPEGAVNVYLLKLSANEDLGLALASERRGALLAQWRSIRADMDKSKVSKLTWPGYDVRRQGEGRAVVTVEVSGEWWNHDGQGTSLIGTPRAWRFDVRHDGGGWVVWSVTPTPWCGGHVVPEACR